MPETKRFSDEKLQDFYSEFRAHVKEFQTHVGKEEQEHKQQQELHDAIFRKEDSDTNTPPGLLQLTMRINTQLSDMRKFQDRQKSFVGGVLFTVSSIWFFLTDAGQKLADLWHKLF